MKKGKLVKSKPKFNPFTKSLMMNTAGFPDFICFRKEGDKFDVIGVEVKMNGLLSKEEKEKCRWYLQKEIFSKIWIAKKGNKRGEIEYIDFTERYSKE
jgi:hypothetical protein